MAAQDSWKPAVTKPISLPLASLQSVDISALAGVRVSNPESITLPSVQISPITLPRIHWVVVIGIPVGQYGHSICSAGPHAAAGRFPGK